jgi:hypothetical protein
MFIQPDFLFIAKKSLTIFYGHKKSLIFLQNYPEFLVENSRVRLFILFCIFQVNILNVNRLNRLIRCKKKTLKGSSFSIYRKLFTSTFCMLNDIFQISIICTIDLHWLNDKHLHETLALRIYIFM